MHTIWRALGVGRPISPRNRSPRAPSDGTSRPLDGTVQRRRCPGCRFPERRFPGCCAFPRGGPTQSVRVFFGSFSSHTLWIKKLHYLALRKMYTPTQKSTVYLQHNFCISTNQKSCVAAKCFTRGNIFIYVSNFFL